MNSWLFLLIVLWAVVLQGMHALAVKLNYASKAIYLYQPVFAILIFVLARIWPYFRGKVLFRRYSSYPFQCSP